ncbi:hypothetical protein EG68_05074, partial [Paragonimus skrjabini miyazakii]
DTGVTVELIKGIPKATKWTGDQLYRSQHEPGLLDVTEVFRRRVLRTTTSSSDYGTRVRRNMGTEDKRAVSITQSELTVRIWRLDELLPTDCTDKVVMFLGAISPGHYSLRRRMTELGLTLNPFVGRIGITNEKPSQDGSLFLEEYVNAPVARLGDTHFTDLQQRGEAFVVSNLKPDLQYCLQFSPDSVDMRSEVDELKLDKSKLGSPWEPGITMTVRFNPTITPTEDIVLLRLQMASAEWLTISITPGYRLGLGIPGATSKLFTQESLTDRPLDDPAYALNELEIAEARMINASIPAWKELTSTETDNLDSGLPLFTTGKFEVTITLHFGKANSQRLHVLFDQRLVQSWTIPSQANVGPIEQALIGPFTKVKQPITISYLLIGTHLVDFAAELSIAEGKPGVHIGGCGGQLHPRFLRRVGPLGILWVAQGLDLAPPPGGRRLRFVEMLADNTTLPDVSQLPSMPADSRLRREETANSFWEINDLGSRLEDIEPPFEFTIGFRAQLSQGSKAVVDPETLKVENTVTGVQYNLLAAFNYGPERGNLYVLLSESQIIVTDSKKVLWSSPHLTISDSSWHRLTLAIPKNDILNDLNGVESGVYIIFDGRHLWLPKVSSNGVPILAFIGGLPSTLKLTLPPNENIAPVTNMFGCVDELVINGIEINPRISGRPTCYDCFSLDPNMIHVPESIRNYMKTELIPLQIPPAFLQSNLKQMTFDFSFFYDRDKLKSANLFVLVFEDEDTGKLVHVILYLANAEIRMAFVDGDESLTDYGNSASLLSLPRNKNTWHFVKLDMILAYNSIVLMLRSQIAQSLPLVLEDVQRLKAIYFSQNKDCRGECTGELLIKADSVKTHIDNLNVTSLAYQGVARLSQQAESVAKRFSPERVQKEEDLIQQVQQLARETSMARDATDQARRMRDTLELARCQAQENLTKVNQAIERLDTRVKDWIDRVQELPLTIPDSSVLQRWLEEARRVRTELNAIKLNATYDAMSKLQKEVEKVIESAKDLTQTVRPGRSAIELRRLEAYQQQQRKLLELQTTQLYGIGNATQKASKELGLAQTKSSALKKAATDAADLNTIHKFETNVTKLRALLDSMSELPSEEVQKLVDDAKLALQNITSVDLIDLDRIHIPPNLESDVIQPLEREVDAIKLTLQFSTKVNQTIQALDAYQTIVDNMRRATNATMQAEEALKESAAAESQTWQELLEQVTQKNEDITSLLDESAEVLQNHNKTLNLATKQLMEASSDLDEIQKTADKTLSDAQEVNSKINVIKQLLTDTEPQAQNVSAMTGSQMEKMSELRDRLQSVENRYAKLQGTAQSTVDQANNTLLNLVKSISETETTVKQLDTKLLRLRRLADEARSLLDVSYGALAKDPVPLRLNRDCVYSLVPYALTKSRVFDIEFWFRLHPEQSQMNSVLMIGRRAFAGRTQMFAFTLESSSTKLRFSWNVMNGKLELNAIRTGIWYQVRVISVSGETRMMLIERPDEEKSNSNSQPIAREVSTRAGANHPEAALMLDRQMEIRVGGALQPGSRLVNPEAWGVNGAETLWSRLLSMDATQFCIFNLRVGGVAMSIVDLATASPSCKQPSRLDCQLFNYRPLARNGYVWRSQNELTDVTNETRPPQSLQTNYLLKRLFYYDFAGTGGYARIEEFKDLKFCEDRVQFQLTPLTDAQRNPMMVFTFFNYDKVKI